MFKLKRTTKDAENKFTVTTPDGYITIAGTGDFVVRMVRSLCTESEEFLNILRENMQGETHESIAAEMRKAGFPEDIVTDFENDNFWADVIFDKKKGFR
jgi:hypothetical protein